MRILSEKWLTPVVQATVEPTISERITVYANPLQETPAPPTRIELEVQPPKPTPAEPAEVASEPPADWWEEDPFLVDDAPQIRLPRIPPAPCPKCNSPFFWGDTLGEAHCCECVPIPNRAVASGEAWQVLWGHDENHWSDWTPQHWNPFAHVEATQRARDAALPRDNF